MEAEQIAIFDTTLRDGTQGSGISLSVENKLRIARKLDEFGVSYIEGGWPMSNPKDHLFFQEARHMHFHNARLVAFGSTMHPGSSAETDQNLRQLVEAGTPTVSIFGKSWLLHVSKALKVTPERNLELISESVHFLKSRGREVIYDAEHFFDGFKSNPEYSLKTLQAAASAGADVLVLCDTNGGTTTSDLVKIIRAVQKEVHTPLGIHCHNDSDLAVANSIAAVELGCRHLQGTINGYGERCGNANLCSLIPNLQLKMGYRCVPEENISRLTELSYFVSEIANLAVNPAQPYVGHNAFSHKGGVHVSAVMKDASTYEHIAPEQVGNHRQVVVSDLSGKSNILYKSKEMGIDLTDKSEKLTEIVQDLKHLEHEGFQFEAAEGSLELFLRRKSGETPTYFELKGFRVLMEQNENDSPRAEATIRLLVNGKEEHTAAEGVGPVHALDNALRKALFRFFPEINNMKLSDYKVRVLNEKKGTAAKVRVLIESQAGQNRWSTIGVSHNIIHASWQALSDSVAYYLMRLGVNRPKHSTYQGEVKSHVG